MSEFNPPPEDLNDLDTTTNFSQDLAQEITWRQDLQKQLIQEDNEYEENFTRQNGEDARINELRQNRIDRALSPDYASMSPKDRIVRLEQVRATTIKRREEEQEQGLNTEGSPYHGEEMHYIDEYLQQERAEWYAANPQEFTLDLKSRITERMPNLPDISKTAGDFKTRLLKDYSRIEQKMLATIYLNQGLDSAFTVFSEMVDEIYDGMLEGRNQQEQLVLSTDQSGEWGMSSLELPAIEGDPDFLEIVARNQKPAELEEVIDKLLLERFKIFVDPNNYNIRGVESVQLERQRDQLVGAWIEQFASELQPLIHRRYEELANVSMDSQHMLIDAESVDQDLLPAVDTGRTVLPVAAIVSSQGSKDWRLLDAKDGSSAKIINLATRIAMGRYAELNKYGDEGTIIAQLTSDGGVRYEAAGGAHRVAAHKLVGRRTIVMNCSTRESSLIKRLEPARV